MHSSVASPNQKQCPSSIFGVFSCLIQISPKLERVFNVKGIKKADFLFTSTYSIVFTDDVFYLKAFLYSILADLIFLFFFFLFFLKFYSYQQIVPCSVSQGSVRTPIAGVGQLLF